MRNDPYTIQVEYKSPLPLKSLISSAEKHFKQHVAGLQCALQSGSISHDPVMSACSVPLMKLACLFLLTGGWNIDCAGGKPIENDKQLEKALTAAKKQWHQDREYDEGCGWANAEETGYTMKLDLELVTSAVPATAAEVGPPYPCTLGCYADFSKGSEKKLYRMLSSAQGFCIFPRLCPLPKFAAHGRRLQ